MPVIGFGLHLLIALYFGIHAIRSGQSLFWLVILFSFPLLGSLVYFFAIYLPGLRLPPGNALPSAARTIAPSRELREARAAFEFAPSAQNQLHLAAALLDAGQADEAAATYEACLSGPFADDPDIRLGAAIAHAESQHPERAIEQLERIRKTQSDYRAEHVSLLLARALSQSGRRQEAKHAFESAIETYGSFDATAEYLIWALSSNEKALAERLEAEIQRITAHWNRQTRELNRPLLRRLDAAHERARQATP